MNLELDTKDFIETDATHINGNINHFEAIESSSNAAQRRLENLVGNDSGIEHMFDGTLFCLRYCLRPYSPERVWGIFAQSVLYVLWWDSKHEVSGSPKDVSQSDTCETFRCVRSQDVTVLNASGLAAT